MTMRPVRWLDGEIMWSSLSWLMINRMSVQSAGDRLGNYPVGGRLRWCYGGTHKKLPVRGGRTGSNEAALKNAADGEMNCQAGQAIEA